jgi:hypothetical protein
MPRTNDAELAAARGRVTRGKLVFLFCLLMVPASAVASCGGAAALLPPQDRAFGLLPALVLPVVFLIAAFFARRPPKAAAAEVALVRWADENGFVYHRRATGKPAAERAYKMGGEIEWKFHMAGEVGGTRVELVNRWSRNGFAGVAEVEAEQTEAVLVGAVPADLDFALLPKGEMGEVNDLTRGERARFRDDPEFDRAFIVYARDAEAVEAGLPERFAARCRKRPEYTVVVRGGTLVVFRLNHVCLPPDGYDALLDHALALAAALG